jgi:prolyl oligopeptidase
MNPTLIRIDVKAGHGAGKSVAATIQENVDIQAFTLYNIFKITKLNCF